MGTEQEEFVSDTEIFDEAVAADPVATEEPKEAVQETQSEEGRQRDEKGRFVAKEQPEQAEPEARADPEPEPKEEKQDHRIPLMELLNEREKRQAEQRRAEALASQLEQMQRQIAQMQQPQQIPDQFANPDDYNAFWMNQLQTVQQQFQQQLKAVQAENSLARAHERYGETFEKGYQEIMDRANQGDRHAAQLVVNSPNPGEAIVNWYKREETVRRFGDNPDAYAKKEDLLKDPEFLAMALEAAKGIAQAQPTQQIKLPPSLNKAAAAGSPSDKAVMGDAAIYQHAIGR